jgi:hypothetical protein
MPLLEIEELPMDEEIVLLEEQLATASADIERLQTLLSEAESKALSRDR